jgi:hypothetical protein
MLKLKEYILKKPYSCGQNGSNHNVLGLSMLQTDQSVSDGHKINISKWRIRRRSLHRTTIRVSTIRKGRLCLQIEESSIWA